MSIVESIQAWRRKTFAWSNSRQSWQERFSVVALAIGIVIMVVWGSRLLLIQQVLLWSFLLLLAALSLRRGWLKLFGPVLFYDMLCLARRSRYFWVRTGYAALLISFLFMTWLGLRHQGASQRTYALLAETYFGQFMFIQLIAVSVLTPAYVAGSIADEKDRKTLEFMLATDLRNREIVLSKLCARLANLTLFILTGLPILSILQFLGGVDPNLMLAGFLTTFMTMIGLGGFSILCSVWLKRPRDAIAISYLGPITYLSIGTVGYAMLFTRWSWISWPLGWWQGAPTIHEAIDLINTGNLVVALIKFMQAYSFGGGIGAVLPGLLIGYSTFHALLGLGCTLWAVVRLRAIALRQAHGTTRKASKWQRPRPEIGDLPMLWKEIHIEGNIRFNWAARICVLLLFLLIFGGGLWGTLYAAFFENMFFNDPDGLAMGVNTWIRFGGTLVACLMLLGVSIRASTAISTERDKDTFDSLLTTPLDSDAILLGKFLGCMAGMRRGMIWLALIWLVGLIAGGLQPFALPLILGAIFIYAAAFTILGLWYSMVSKTSMRSTLWTILTVVGVSAGHWLPTACFALASAFRDDHDVMENLMMFQAGMTPPFVLGLLPVGGYEFRHGDPEFMKLIGFSLFGLLLYGVGAFFFWVILLSPRFRQLTHREDFLYPRATAAQEMLKHHG